VALVGSGEEVGSVAGVVMLDEAEGSEARTVDSGTGDSVAVVDGRPDSSEVLVIL